MTVPLKNGKEDTMMTKMKPVDMELQKANFKALFIRQLIEYKNMFRESEINTVKECVWKHTCLCCGILQKILNLRHKTKSNQLIGTPHT